MKYNDAVSLALFAHQNQYRKEGTPYAVHVLYVGDMLVALGMPNYVYNAGYLHDAREDSPYATEQDIIDTCGYETLELVKLVTKVPYEDAKKLKKGEKGYNVDEYNQKICNSFFGSNIKIVDRISNISSVRCGDEKFQKKYIKETVDKYTDMAYKLYNVDNYDNNFTDEEKELYGLASTKIANLFKEKLIATKLEVGDEIYCPIEKKWYSKDDAIYIDEEENIPFSKEGFDEYMFNLDKYEDEGFIKFIKDDIENYIMMFDVTDSVIEIDDERDAG